MTPHVWNDFLHSALNLKVVHIDAYMAFRTDAATTTTTLETVATLPSLRLLRFSGIPQAHCTLQFQPSLVVLLWSHESMYFSRDSENFRDPIWDCRECSKLTWAHLDLCATGIKSIGASLESLTATTSSSLAYLKVTTTKPGRSSHHKGALRSVRFESGESLSELDHNNCLCWQVQLGVLEVLSTPYSETKSIVTFLQQAKTSSLCRLTWLEVQECPGVDWVQRTFCDGNIVERHRREKDGFLELLNALGELLSDSGLECLRGVCVGRYVWLRGFARPPRVGGVHGAGCWGEFGFSWSSKAVQAEAFEAACVRTFEGIIRGIVQRTSVLVGEDEEDVVEHLRDSVRYGSPGVPGFGWSWQGCRSRP
eukprot:2457305-Rhodomonas_salina.1